MVTKTDNYCYASSRGKSRHHRPHALWCVLQIYM